MLITLDKFSALPNREVIHTQLTHCSHRIELVLTIPECTATTSMCQLNIITVSAERRKQNGKTVGGLLEQYRLT